MNAKELRLGNLVLWDNEIVPIDLIMIETVNVRHKDSFIDWYTVDIEDIEPIAITEEILLKAGFKNCGQGTYNHDYFEGIYFELDSDFIGYEYQNICGDYDGCIHIRLPKEFHKLQNIIFDLTGKELTL